MNFDPNSPAKASDGVFGLPHKEKDAALVYLPVPWEATASYGSGSSKAPKAIFKASLQVDLYDPEVLKPYEAGLFMRPESSDVKKWNTAARRSPAKVNSFSEKLNDWVYAQSQGLIGAGKIIGLIGGEHSVSYGAIKAISEKSPDLGILHFDAHHDLRLAYNGHEHSHASIMRNVINDCPGVSKMVQVGIRDFCEEEVSFVQDKDNRIQVFYDHVLQRRKFSGEAWDKIAEDIIAGLPKKVWISFDIDGLDPALCPSTGTPVPGGLNFAEANAIVRALVLSGREIPGFDLVEVVPGKNSEWDANVGARLLYKLSAWTLASLKLAQRL